MDFTKFIAMLESGALYFSRADHLGDPFEGSYSRANERERPLRYKSLPPDVASMLETNAGSFSRWFRQWTYISCWHMNEAESAAMWKLYAKTNEAVAISTTFLRLDQQLDEHAYLGLVDYIDFEADWIPESNAFYPYLYKRRSFSHENEVRAVIRADLPVNGNEIDTTVSSHELGKLKPVVLSELISAVHVAPTCPKWFARLVEDVCRRYSLAVPVRQSDLDAEPFF